MSTPVHGMFSLPSQSPVIEQATTPMQLTNGAQIGSPKPMALQLPSIRLRWRDQLARTDSFLVQARIYCRCMLAGSHGQHNHGPEANRAAQSCAGAQGTRPVRVSQVGCRAAGRYTSLPRNSRQSTAGAIDASALVVAA